MSKLFGDNLKYLRTIKRISQGQLADKLKINKSTISRWESNEIDPTVSNVIQVANLLGVPVADLVGIDMRFDNVYVDELEELFLQYKHLLTDDDRDTIRFIIEKRVKENER